MDIVAAIDALCARERATRPGSGSVSDKVGALRDVDAALRTAGIRYAVIGGVAVGIRSETPRTRPSRAPSNAPRTCSSATGPSPW